LATLLSVRDGLANGGCWLSTGTVVTSSSFTAPREAIWNELRQRRLHLVILGSTFILFPAMILPLSIFPPGLLTAPLWTGILFIAAPPSTVQSAIAFTSIARGNVPAAIAAASAPQVLSVFLALPLFAWLAGIAGHAISLSSSSSCPRSRQATSSSRTT